MLTVSVHSMFQKNAFSSGAYRLKKFLPSDDIAESQSYFQR